MAKNSRKSTSDVLPELQLQLGSQYLCHADLDVPGSPEVFLNVQAPPHLHLVVNINLRKASDSDSIYEVRLTLNGYGFPKAPVEGEKLSTLYQANVVYAGLFGVEGAATADEQEAYLVQHASGYLMPPARTILLGLIRESGFAAANPQPIDFREFWHNYKKNS